MQRLLVRPGFLVVLCLLLPLAVAVRAEWASTRATVYIGPWPSSTDPVVDHLKRGDPVSVLERQSGFARITPYVKPKEVGLKGRRKVARWVSLRQLTEVQPLALPKAPCEHKDIAPNAFPMAGPGHGLSFKEGELLCRGALAILARDDCKQIEYGDKSLSKPGAFFVNCGASNIFFSEKDLPRAEEPSSGVH